MKNLTATLCLTVAMLLMVVGCQTALNGYHSNIKMTGGATYSGDILNGKPHGQGTVTFVDGKKYVGEFEYGKKHGHGTLTDLNGTIFVGEFKDDKANGQATITIPDGDKYVGEFKDNKRNGLGTLTFANGRIREGIWKNDIFQYAQKVSPTATAGKPSQNSQTNQKAEQLKQRELDRKREIAVPVSTNDYAIAVIIGNKTYDGSVPEVSFAHNDADAFRKYVVKGLGYREGNIIDLRDATYNQMVTVFGNKETHEGKLFDFVRPGESDVTVFYSGHGVPGLKDKRAYLLPKDGDPNRGEISGYPISTLYENLNKLSAKSVHVFIDACFSGETPKGMLVKSASGISVTPKLPMGSSRMVILTAAQEDQLASWDEDAKHGLFTKHLLEALYGAADEKKYGDGDGKVTLAEVGSYLNREMTYQARRRFGRVQEASLTGIGSDIIAPRIVEREKIASVVTAPKSSQPSPVKPQQQPKTKKIVGSYTSDMTPGDVFKDCPKCPEIVIIPAGSFEMGFEPENADKRIAWSRPVHRVSIRKAFGMGKYEVTNEEFRYFLQNSGFEYDFGCKSQRSTKDKHPASCIKWKDAKAYVDWLSSRTGEVYSLPSEAKWEYAARAGNTSETPWKPGQSPCQYANLRDESNIGKNSLSNNQYVVFKEGQTLSCNDGFTYSSPVGSYLPNNFGLFDVVGNVFEWTDDCWNGNYEGAPNDGSAWEAGNCSKLVHRSLGWEERYASNPFSQRLGISGGSNWVTQGFRVMRSVH
jgi:formylglycine-generating enzyme required for sulfatase activity